MRVSSNGTNGLEFLCIGANKTGTTSLHQYMRTHPELFLPEAKEQLFFNWDEAYEEGWDEFAAVAFYGAPDGRQRGMVTPQYLGGPVIWRDSTIRAAETDANEVIATRIAEHFPDIKLIVMMRDPCERAVSSYWQHVVLGDESRTIDEAFLEELSEPALSEARAVPGPTHMHVVGGEYGRLMDGYLRHFDRNLIFIGSTAMLAEDPVAVMKDLWRFLGVDDSHVPANLGERYQVRGAGRRSPLLTSGSELARRSTLIRRAWRSVPAPVRTRARHWLRVTTSRQDQKSQSPDPSLHEDPSPEVAARLRQHYEPDLARLELIVGPVPGVTAPMPSTATTG